MRKYLSALIFVALIIMMVPGKEAAAYNAPSQGMVVSDQEYSGVTPVNEGGNHIPVRYELPVEQNSMIRLILYTDSECDCSINIENQNSPYEEADRYGSFPGSNLTAVNDFYNPAPNVYSTSSFGVTADKRNPAVYTEVFGDIAKGNYYIVIRGNSYRFKIVIEPLKFDEDFSNSHDIKDNAADYTVGSEQKGILISNGLINNNFIDGNKSMNSWYKFTADKGSYHMYFHTDGFFQGTAYVLDKDGYSVIEDSSKNEVFYTFDHPDSFAGTYEEHLLKATTVETAFELEEDGTYYVNISKRAWTTGSYMFQVVSDEEVAGDGEDISGESEVALSSINISPAKPTIKAGASVTLKATAVYSDGSMEDVTEFVSWSSSNKKAATVDEAGTVKGVAAGKSVIKATLEGKESSITVTVTAVKKLTKIVPQKATVYMKVGVTATNKITAYYSDGSKVTVTDKVVLKSSSTSIKIYKNKELKAMKKGTFTITITYGGVKTTYKVVVK